MRVIDNKTDQVYEVGLFADSGWAGWMKIRLLDFPLVFGDRGADAGFLETWEGYGEEGDDSSITCCKFDMEALEFFDLDLDDPLEDMLDGPHAALKTIIYLSPRFRAAIEGD